MPDSEAVAVEVTPLRTVGKNTVVTLVGTLVNAAASALLTIIAARYLGDEKFGVYGFAASFGALFSVFADLGLGTLAVREVAQDRRRLALYLDNIWTMKWLLGGCFSLLACITINVMNRSLDVRLVVYAVSGSVFLGSISSGLRWSFQAFQIMEYDALYVVTLALLRLGGALGVLMAGYGVLHLALVDVAANAVVLVGMIAIVRRVFGWHLHWSPDVAFWKRLLREAFPLALMLVFSAVYLNNGPVLLSALAGDAATGWYAAANRLAGLMRFIPAVFVPAIYPVMSEAYTLSGQRFAMVVGQSLRLLLLAGLPIVVFLTVFGDAIVRLIYGGSFANAVRPLQMLAWSALFMFVSSVLGYGLISAGLQKVNAAITGLGMLVNVLLNWILIPRYAAVGASISVLAVEAIVASLAILAMRKNRLSGVTMMPLLRLGCTALLMGGALYALREHLALAALLGVPVYLVGSVLTGAVSLDDCRLASRMVARS